jgi:hypothetical protein
MIGQFLLLELVYKVLQLIHNKLFSGSYILFRRGISMWQDRRAPRVTTVRWR